MPFKTLKNGRCAEETQSVSKGRFGSAEPKRRASIRAALVAAAICVATAPSPSFATDGVWLDGASGNIGDDANWQTKYSGTTPKLSFANTTANAAYVTNDTSTAFGNVCFNTGDFYFQGPLNCKQVQVPGAESSASLTKTGGDWTLSGAFLPGYISGSTGAFTNLAGKVTGGDTLRLGYSGNSVSECVLSGGSFSFKGAFQVGFGDGATGTFIVDGATATFNTGSGLSPGEKHHACIGRGNNSSGCVIVRNGGVITVNKSYATYMGGREGSTTGSSGTLRLESGGVYTTRNIYSYDASDGGTVVFDGGTLKAGHMSYPLSSGGLIRNVGNITVKVCEGGGTLHTGGYCPALNKQFVSGVEGAADGGMTIKGGGELTNSVVHAYTGVTTIEVDTKVVVSDTGCFPGGIVAALPSGGGMGTFAFLVSTGGAFSQEFVEAISVPSVDDGKEFTLSLSADGKTVYAQYAYSDGFWTGENGTDLCDPLNWTGGVVPSGTPAYIGETPSLPLTCSGTFSPSSIAFVGSADAVSIVGEGKISGVAKITNRVAARHVINIPVEFSGNIDTFVAVAGGQIDYAGGVTGSRIVAANEASSILVGKYTMTDTALWPPVTQGGGGEVYTLSGAGSTLYVPLADLKRFVIEKGTSVTVGNALHDGGNYLYVVSNKDKKYFWQNVTYANWGVYRVLGEMKNTGNAEVFCARQADKFSGKMIVNRLTYGLTKQNGFHDDYFHLTTGHRKDDGSQAGFGATTWVIGPGGIGFDTSVNLRCQDQWYITQADCELKSYADWTLEQNPSNATVATAHALTVDKGTLTFDTSHFTMDDAALDAAETHKITLAGSIDGAGAVKATGGGEVAFKAAGAFTGGLTADGATVVSCLAGCNPGDGAVTLNGTSTLEVAQSGTVALGGVLTLAEDATLAFNFTDTVTPPALSGTSVTASAGGVNVKVSSTDGLRPRGGDVALTSGMDFTGMEVNLVDSPDWVKCAMVVDGNIVLSVKLIGFAIFIR